VHLTKAPAAQRPVASVSGACLRRRVGTGTLSHVVPLPGNDYDPGC
jgi:hypothetical protein